MNTKFKSYKSKLLLAGLVVLAPVGVDAKAAVEQATDTAGAEKEMKSALSHIFALAESYP